MKQIVAMEVDHEDDDYEPNNGDMDDLSPYTLRRRPPGDDVSVGRTNSAQKRAKLDPVSERSTTRLPTNIKSLSKSLDHISKQLKGLEYDTKSSLRVVYSVLTLQKEYLQNKQKKQSCTRQGLFAPGPVSCLVYPHIPMERSYNLISPAKDLVLSIHPVKEGVILITD